MAQLEAAQVTDRTPEKQGAASLASQGPTPGPGTCGEDCGAPLTVKPWPLPDHPAAGHTGRLSFPQSPLFTCVGLKPGQQAPSRSGRRRRTTAVPRSVEAAQRMLANVK